MKKALVSMAVAAAALFSFQSFAQQPAQQPCPGPGQCAPAPCYGAPCAPQSDSCFVKKARYNQFDGLNLSQDQQTKIDNLRKQYAPPTPQQLREQAKARRADYLKELKTILTPEQYVQFLENNYLNAPAGPRFGKGQKGPRVGKDGKFDKKDRKDRKDRKDDRKDKKDKK